MRLISWNVNGVRAVARKGMLEWFAKERPDVLCLQETKAMPEQLGPELLAIPDYAVEWTWAEKKGYSGVATYSRAKHKEMTRGLGIKRYDAEGRVMVTQFKDFTLFNVYFPNGKASPERLRFKLDFYDDFLDTMERWRKKGHKNLIVCGDVNTAHREIDLARPKENKHISGFLPEERAWIDKLLERGWTDAFRQFESGPEHYTWWDQQSRARDRNVGWRIDYFFVTEELKPALKRSFHLPDVLGSDHCPVGIELDV